MVFLIFQGYTEFSRVSVESPMKCVSVGQGGIWGVRAKDETIWVRMHENNSKPVGKVKQDTGTPGEGWARVTVRKKIR